jgi:hypothetical protein
MRRRERYILPTSMKLPTSTLGFIFALIYTVVSVTAIYFQGLFGESFIALILGVPWSILFASFEYGNATRPILYVLLLGPLVLNACILYMLGSRIEATHQKPRNLNSLHTKAIFFLIAAIIVGIIGWQLYTPTETQPESIIPIPTRQPVTVSGTHVCLPHTNTSGPQTLECALGIQTDEGIYYALDLNALSVTPFNVPTGSRITVRGIITPIEELSTDMWQKYPIKGIFSVTDSLKQL